MRFTPLKTLLAAALFCCLSAGPAIAAGESCRLTVKAGKHDRLNSPVRVLIPAAAEAKSVTLTTAEGKRLPAQLTAPCLVDDSAKGKRELHFVLPSLEKGKSLDLTAVLSTDGPPAGGFAWRDQPGEFAELMEC